MLVEVNIGKVSWESTTTCKDKVYHSEIMKRLLPVSPLSDFRKSSDMHSPDHFYIQILLDMSKHANDRGQKSSSICFCNNRPDMNNIWSENIPPIFNWVPDFLIEWPQNVQKFLRV